MSRTRDFQWPETPTWCKPGAPVLCIHGDRHFLQTGCIYIVREVVETPRMLGSLIGLEWPCKDSMLWGVWRFADLGQPDTLEQTGHE